MVINAAGTPQSAVLKPVLLVGLIGAIVMSSMTLYFAPLSLRIWRTLITDVRGNIITTILHEGEFMSLAPGLTFHLRRRSPDGTMEGIFMSDSRDPETTVTYLAERGAVLDNPLGVFHGDEQRHDSKDQQKDQSNSIIEFTSYAYDLSSFAAQSSAPPFRPQERPTAYLIHPNPNDRLYQQFPGKFRSELHYRLTAPFNAILFAILPLVFLGQAETTRQQRSATIGLAVGSAVGFGVLQFVLTSAAEDHFLAVLGLYVVPLAAITLGPGLVLAGKQPRPPESMLAIGEAFAQACAGSSAALRRRRRGAADPACSPSAGRSPYFAKRFAFMVLAIFLFFVLLIGSITYLEYLTRSISGGPVRRSPGHPPHGIPGAEHLRGRAPVHYPVRIDCRLRHRQSPAGSGGGSCRRHLCLAIPAAGLRRRTSIRCYFDDNIQPCIDGNAGLGGRDPGKASFLGAGGRYRVERSGLVAPSRRGPRIDRRRAAVLRARTGPCGGDSLHFRAGRTVSGTGRRADRPFRGWRVAF